MERNEDYGPKTSKHTEILKVNEYQSSQEGIQATMAQLSKCIKKYAKDIPSLVFDPRKTYLDIVVQLRDDPDSVRVVSSLIINAKVTIINVVERVRPDHKELSMLVESSGIRPQSMKALIDSSPYTIDSIVNESKNGLLIDKVHYPLQLPTGQDVLVLRKDGLVSMFAKLKSSFGVDAEVILYEEGYALGKSAAEYWLEQAGETFVKENMQDMVDMYIVFGWCWPKMASFDLKAPSAHVVLHDNFECVGQKSRRPHSNYVRGHLCGLVSTLLGKDLRCTEVRCISKGDEFCEFSLSC